jgi:hypothetical protein
MFIKEVNISVTQFLISKRFFGFNFNFFCFLWNIWYDLKSNFLDLKNLLVIFTKNLKLV